MGTRKRYLWWDPSRWRARRGLKLHPGSTEPGTARHRVAARRPRLRSSPGLAYYRDSLESPDALTQPTPPGLGEAGEAGPRRALESWGVLATPKTRNHGGIGAHESLDDTWGAETPLGPRRGGPYLLGPDCDGASNICQAHLTA